MPCPHCASTTTCERPARTQLGYRTFHCLTCRRIFNQRTGTPFNHLTLPTEIVLQVVLWRLRYKLSLRDLAEMFLERGFCFTHEAVREWEARFAPLLAEKLRAKRQGQAGSSWYVDETYLKVNGQWCYLYRAIDREGNLSRSQIRSPVPWTRLAIDWSVGSNGFMTPACDKEQRFLLLARKHQEAKL